jgi:2-hydroxy-3-keto-5-methylthiopentenyl-1-phosphate phosphatase
MTLPPPPLDPAAPPLAILVDYDGTIAQTDVSDALMADFVTEEWEARAAEYDAGLVGSRRLMEWEVGLITTDPESLRAFAAAQPHDPGFAPLVRRAQAAGIPVEVVSDGFGFFIPAALAALGVPDVPVISASTTFDAEGRARIEFPNGNPACFVCGTCKRNRVLAHQAAGRAVVFIGDGESDRYAAGYSDIVFAKRALVKLCLANGWPFRRWTEFAEIDAWLATTIERWRADPASLPAPRRAPFFCGPEVWGPGRWDPPAPAGYPEATNGSEGVVPG